ncbi:hypothetical protein CSOJ01_13448 [Colletotrichum sojae]|uniref:GPI anchored protein n=1 Tax=Colletotrichum sojae TaxID=2175907 RepID=A0A8H6IT70_9PEZI|nr:hypothetical protein CSOJ01_13448 [Colletotrichum sojae]
MKTFQILAILGFSAISMAQTAVLAPSPTASWGCEPHGDHWHCEGSRATTAAAAGTTLTTSVSAATTSAAEDHDHDHDDHDDHDDDHASGTGSLPPSPTASVGCEPHGDHWYVESASSDLAFQKYLTLSATTAPAATTGAVATTAANSASPSTTAVPAGAARAGFGAAAIAAALMAL